MLSLLPVFFFLYYACAYSPLSSFVVIFVVFFFLSYIFTFLLYVPSGDCSVSGFSGNKKNGWFVVESQTWNSSFGGFTLRRIGSYNVTTVRTGVSCLFCFPLP